MRLIYTFVFVGLIAILLIFANTFLENINLALSASAYLNKLLKYQLFAFLVALCAVILTLKLNPTSFKLLKIGDVNALAQAEKWLGIAGEQVWKKEALQLLLVVSLATGFFMYMVLDASGALNHFAWNLLPCICFCALLNALSEELIFRFVIHGNLQDVVPKKNVLMLSAVLFGLPHYWGYPSGLVGVAMAGFLGYVLSKITYETQGLGLAWGIHFVQDVIIFTALFMMYY